MSVYQHKSKETKVTLLLRDPRTFVSPWSTSVVGPGAFQRSKPRVARSLMSKSLTRRE